MTQQLLWLDHIGSINEGVRLINRLGWNITFGQSGDRWYVQSGEKVILNGETCEAMEAFIYGMALSYSVLPTSYVEDLRNEFGIEENE